MTLSERKARECAKPDPQYTVKLGRGTGSAIAGLSDTLYALFWLLVDEMYDMGPRRDDWLNYGTLHGQKGQTSGEKRYYCHLAQTRPSYVVCWRTVPGVDNIEIYYVGTHSKAPY